MIPTEYYGDNTRWFIATVVSATAPAGYEGRVKIRIHGLHSASNLDIPEKDLPWAQCILPTTEGGVSGIGRIPRLLPSAMVFGFFVDGINSQTPIILGSIPHVELPSQIQLGQPEEDVGAERPEGFWNKVVEVIRYKGDVKNDTTGTINVGTTKEREKAAVSFFLNLGYTLNQSVGIVSGLKAQSRLITGQNFGSDFSRDGFGIAGWSRDRFTNLKTYSNDYELFTTQLEFVAYELKGLESSANIRLLNTENLTGKDGSCQIFSRYYLKKRDRRFISTIEKDATKLKDKL